MAQFTFDPNQHKLQESLEVLPTGWYPAKMIESDVVPTSKGDGFRLAVIFEIIDGPAKGRKIKSGFNIQNPSAQAVEISMNEIKTMQTCMGLFVPIQDSQQMHNLPLQIRLGKAADSDYNEVKGYKSINGQDAKDVISGAANVTPVGHVGQPPQGYGQPPAADPTAGWQRQNGYRLNPATNAWEPDAPAAPAPPPAPAAPAWAPPAVAQPYTPPAPQATLAAPAWTPGATTAAPAWAPQK